MIVFIGLRNPTIGTFMKPFLETQEFIDRNADEIPLSSESGINQFAQFCLAFDENPNSELLKQISAYYRKNDIDDILEFEIVSFFSKIVDKNFQEKDWYWHLNRFLLLADSAHLPEQNTHLKNKFTETDYQLLCAALEQSVCTDAPVDFLLEGIEIKLPGQLDEKFVDYLISQQSSAQNTQYSTWLSKHISILSKRYGGGDSYVVLTEKDRILLSIAIAWGINQAIIFVKEHENIQILQSDLPFNLNEIFEVSRLNSLDVQAKTQILLALNEPLSSVEIKCESNFFRTLQNTNHPIYFDRLDFCSSYPADIMKSFTSWEVLNKLVEKHPVFLKHLSEEEVVANFLKLSESDPEQTRGFAKKHLAAFIKHYGSNLSTYHKVYLSGGRKPEETFTFLEKVLNQQEDCIPVILGLPNNRDYIDEIKANALLLIKTAAAYRAICTMYAEYRDSEEVPLGYYDVLAILIDRDENFNFDDFCQLAINNEEIARQFMQIDSKRLRKFLEYQPKKVRELFKKHPKLIYWIKGDILKAAFAQQDDFIGLIPVNSYFQALQALLAIDTPTSMKKAKEHIRSFTLEQKLSIVALFRTFNHAFIIGFLKESFSNDELKSVFTGGHLDSFFHEYFGMNSTIKLSVEMADFLLEHIAEKIDFSPDESSNHKPLRYFFDDCMTLLYESKRLTTEEIFSKYSHIIFEENFAFFKTWKRELTIFLLEKIKCESQSIIAIEQGNVWLKKEDRKENDNSTLKNLIALLPQDIRSNLVIGEMGELCLFWLKDLESDLLRLQEDVKRRTTIETKENKPVIKKSDALFNSDYVELRPGIHACYRQALLEKTDDLSVVGDILADAKFAILTKLENALAKIDLPVESVQSVLALCADESFFPSRFALENILKELCLEEDVLGKLLDQCSDEVIPALLHDSLKQLIVTQEKIDAQTPLIAFLGAVYKDYPQGWARVLIKVLEHYNTYPHEWIKGMVFALGVLREPLGEKTPKMLDKISKDSAFIHLSEVINRQKSLFNRENFKRGHFKKPQRRVAEALQNLMRTHEKISQ